MGRACLRKQHLDAPITQILVWNGEVSATTAGTYSDKKFWEDLGYSSHVINVGADAEIALEQAPHETPKITDNTFLDPSLKAILFGDVAGFSKLTDAQIPVFVERVLGQLAMAIEQSIGNNRDSLLSINTWGDGLFVVFNDVLTATKCALAMQAAMQGLELSAQGISQQPQLRLGAHFGPIFEFEDPMTKRPNFFGQHVNTAARIEPIAPQGEVYVTEAFAAHLALDQRSLYHADYVGEMELAKKYGKARMYLLQEKPA
jgi:class 3 adenylate cyclase